MAFDLLNAFGGGKKSPQMLENNNLKKVLSFQVPSFMKSESCAQGRMSKH
jgi:hypothetical protein